MNRSPIIRRALTLAGATAAATVTALAMATPALACHPELAASCTTNTDKTWTVSWTVTNKGGGKEATVADVKVQPAAELQSIKQGVKFASGTSLTDTQVIPEEVESATLTVKLSWANEDDVERDITVGKGSCTPAPSPSTSQSPSPSVPESPSPSAPESPSSPETPTAPATPTVTPAPGGGGNLPVTGTAVGGITAAAVVLLAGGAVLFVVARRRRIRFTA